MDTMVSDPVRSFLHTQKVSWCDIEEEKGQNEAASMAEDVSVAWQCGILGTGEDRQPHFFMKRFLEFLSAIQCKHGI